MASQMREIWWRRYNKMAR